MKKIVLAIILVIGIICIIYFNINNHNHLEEQWNITLPQDVDLIYDKNPEPSFHNDGIYYEVYQEKDLVSLSFKNEINQEIENEFIEYSKEANISKDYLPDFSQKYEYYQQKETYNSLIIIRQNQKIYVVSSII